MSQAEATRELGTLPEWDLSDLYPGRDSEALTKDLSASDKGAEGISKALADAGAKGAGRVLDVRDAAACAAFVDRVQEEFGPVGILVNNAGVTRDNLLARMKDEEWDEIQQTNLKSVFVLSRAVLRGMMKARSGRIVMPPTATSKRPSARSRVRSPQRNRSTSTRRPVSRAAHSAHDG